MPGALLAQLQDPDPMIPTKAAKELGKLGPAVVAASVPLTALLADPDPMVRGMAAAASGSTGPTSERD